MSKMRTATMDDLKRLRSSLQRATKVLPPARKPVVQAEKPLLRKATRGWIKGMDMGDAVHYLKLSRKGNVMGSTWRINRKEKQNG